MLALCAAPAQAANECGELSATDNSRSIVCASRRFGRRRLRRPSEGNIFYEISDEDADYRFEVREGVVITGVRSNKAQARDEHAVDRAPGRPR